MINKIHFNQGESEYQILLTKFINAETSLINEKKL